MGLRLRPSLAWLHRHVWKRTGWRWAYSPSADLQEWGGMIADAFAEGLNRAREQQHEEHQ